jgi:macrolide-specific efflux system membrane fusion protein
MPDNCNLLHNGITAMNDTTNPVRRRKSSGARKAIIAAVVVAVAGGGWYGWQKYQAGKSEEGEYYTSKVEKGDIEDLVTSTGTLQPRDFVDVGAQVSGQIEKIFVEVGDVVEKGDALAEIDATTAIAKVDGLKAQLLSAETQLKTQETNLEKAERDLKRLENLLAADATTKETVLNQQTTYENAKRTIISSKADIEVRRANLRIEERNLGYTKIIAPIAGTVMKISVKQGQTVNASQNVPVVMQIANLSTMTVQSEVSEADVAKLYKGIPVYFTTLGGNNRRWYGELKRIEPTPKVQNAVVLYNALFDVQNEGGNLMPQMTAQVYFVSAQAKDVLMVPMAALQQGQQIARELAQKERDKKNAAAKPGAAPEGAATASTAAGATREGGQPAAGAATATAPGVGSAPAAAPQDEANRPANAQRPGQGLRAGQPGAGGNFNGPRPGGAGSGGPRGFNPQDLTPEMREQMMRQRAQGGGNFGGRQGVRGNFGAPGAEAGAAGARPAQRRNGTVMVKKADGTLEARRIVYGVTNRVDAQVLEGLTEGEDVVVGKKETEAAAAARPANLPNNQNFQQNNRGNQAFPAGGGNFQGGGGGGGGGRF